MGPRFAGTTGHELISARRKRKVSAMRYIDAFNHFFPKRIYELMLQSPAGQKDLGKRMQGIPALYDVEERLRVSIPFPITPRSSVSACRRSIG
jgi:hypothetical protein